MRGRFFWVTAPLVLAACGDEPQSQSRDLPPEPPVPLVTPAGEPRPSESHSSEPRGARAILEETDTFLFEYSYPQKPGDVPSLAAWLDRRIEMERAALTRQADAARRAARGDGFPYNKYSSQTTWKVVADLPDYLSLSADLSTYTGGAHPNYAFDTMVWDKQANKAIEPLDFFISPEALDAVLDAQLCDALNAERERRRGTAVPEESDDLFDACVSTDATNVLLGSHSGKKFDRIGIQIAPYLAGPYAEGTYEFTFDLTPRLLEVVKPEYRAAFASRN